MPTVTVSRGAPASPPPSPTSVVDERGLDATVAAVADNRERWARTSPAERAELLDRVCDDTMAAAQAWVDDAVRAKGIPAGTPAVGEEWHSGPALVARMARLLRDSLRDIDKHGRPQLPGELKSGPEGRVVAPVFPTNMYDRVLFPSTSAEVWMPPGRSAEEVLAQQAWAYRGEGQAPILELVLGAGNIASLAPRDVLYSMFVENRVAVLKCNPVNDYLQPHWEKAFRALIDHGVLRIVKGDAAAGAYLVRHPRVEHIHITGSDKTFDSVVFGPGEEGAARKARGERLIDTPVTAELGNVSPIVIVPGRWSASDMRYQAQHVATMLAHNAGFNCLATRIIVTAADWPQRAAFLDALEQAFAKLPPRSAYYPGAAERHAAFVDQHPDAAQVGHRGEGTLPWTIVRGVDPANTGDACFTTEAWCSLMSETALDSKSPEDFLDRAVAFCNDTAWGTLSMTVLVKRQGEVAAALERAVRDLRYGSVCVNAWTGIAFGLTTCSWGAYPGHPDSDIQSGRGVVGNTFMLRDPEKSVVRSPFRFRPAPAWFAGAKNSEQALKALAAMEAHPSPMALTRLFGAALRP